jgi:putative membrane protein
MSSTTALVLVKSIHMIALVALLWASFSKNVLLYADKLTTENAIKTGRFDKLSAASAGIMLLSGLTMLFWVAKPSAYYLALSAFWLKIAIFIVASALIIWTKTFVRQAKTQNPSPIPKAVRWILRFDFVGLLVMAALGIVIAHGL